MKDTGLLSGTPAKAKPEYVKQLTASEIDLVYMSCTAKKV
jgi:hypothetical protein